MKIIEGKAHFSLEEGTIVEVYEGFVCLGNNQELKEDGYSINHNKVIDSNGKIILAANFKLEGVPLLVKRSVGDVDAHKLYPIENDDYVTDWKRRAYIQGYNAHAETHPFSEANMIQAIEIAQDSVVENFNSDGEHWGTRNIYSVNEIINLVNKQQIPERLELEVEEILGDKGIIAHAFGESEYQLKSDKGIIYY